MKKSALINPKSRANRRLVLIDGHAILHRAYHALPKTLINSHGQLVNAVYGFTRMFFKVVEDLNPDYLIVTFDRPEPTFRHEEFVGYQAQRPKMDRELKDQISLVKEVLEALDIPIYEKPGFEADDLIGTLAKKAKDKKIKTIIVTGDKDIFQLVDKNTFVYVPKRGVSEAEIYDQDKVRESLGVSPEQVVDYKALVGDQSDNYPGVYGIGPKTATNLLQTFGSLEKTYESLDEIKGAVKSKLRKGKDSAKLSQKLAKIVTDSPAKLDLKKARYSEFDPKKVREVFKRLGFKSLMNKIPGVEQGEKKKKKKNGQMKLV